MSIERLLAEPLQVINLGLELFAEELASAGVSVVHVDWRPPAGGDPRLGALLAALEDEEEEAPTPLAARRPSKAPDEAVRGRGEAGLPESGGKG